VQAIEIAAEIDENSEIHIKLPDQQQAGPARVIVLLDSAREQTGAQSTHSPSPRLANQGAKLHGELEKRRISLDEFIATRPKWPADRAPVTLEDMEQAIVRGALKSAGV
jgi:hypothetical protein